MGQALYRTYRTRKLSEIIGQEHITQALDNALKKGMISHAYLFTGPRGSGKTSIARILAHEINQLPYKDASTYLDIIEIDAASNRRIDEIRDLRDKVHIAPTSAKYKVYIIDEVHMLTREAFNALLKTLEEPPAHAIFMLATTEVHKLPETIVSRTQRFTFKPVELTKVAAHLRSIATKEKIDIDDDALAIIAAHGEGSFRDSISLLDQMQSLGRRITGADVEDVLGIAPKTLILELLQAVETHDAVQTVQCLTKLRNQGATAAAIAKQISQLLREQFISNETALSHGQAVQLLTKLLDVPASSDPQTLLEIIILDIALAGRPAAAPVPPQPNQPSVPAAQPPKASRTIAAQSAPAPTVSIEQPVRKTTAASTPKATSTPPTNITKVSAGPAPTGTEILDEAVWPQVLHTIKKQHNTLFSIMNAAQPHFDPGKVTLEVGFSFHQKRLNENHNKKIIAETISQVSGQEMQVQCVLGKGKPATNSAALPPGEENEIVHAIEGTDAAAAAITQKPEQAPDTDYYVAEAEKSSTRPLDAVSNVFGGGELLES